MLKQYVGYHGTGTDAAKLIVEKQMFIKSSGLDEWLGDGVYFFQYPEDARWWCQYGTHWQKYRTGYKVLQAEITPKIVIDLLGSYNDVEKFKRFCDLVKNKSAKLPDGRLRSNYMSLAIKLMCHESTVRLDMIIAGFNQNRKFWYAHGKKMVDKFPMLVTQVQYCVLNTTCIGQIKEYEEGVVKNEE